MTPTPKKLYVHDDLTELAGLRPETARLARELLDLVRRDPRVRILSLPAQLDAVVAQGPHEPFAMAIGVAAAGEAVARALHARAGWFPVIHRIEVAREETVAGDMSSRRAPPDRSPSSWRRWKAPPPSLWWTTRCSRD